MKSDQLLTILKTTIGKRKVVELGKIVAESDFSMEELIDLSLHKDDQIGFRAAWILENIYLTNPLIFIPHLNWFLTNFPNQNNTSARRNFAKILALITKKNAPKEIKEIVSSFKTDHLVETVFAWVIDDEVAVAIKSHCLNILANLNTKHPWIKDELLQTMDFLVDKESIAFYAKAKQIRKQLK